MYKAWGLPGGRKNNTISLAIKSKNIKVLGAITSSDIFHSLPYPYGLHMVQRYSELKSLIIIIYKFSYLP